MRTRLSWFLLLVLAGAGAIWLGPTPPSRPASVDPSPRGVRTRSDLASSPDAPAAANAFGSGEPPPPGQPAAPQAEDRAELRRRLEVLTQLQQEEPRVMMIPLFEITGAPALSKKFISSFELTEAETSRLNAAIREARQALQSTIESTAIVAERTATETVIQVPPFDGTSISEPLWSAFRSVLGGERFPYFEALSTGDLRRSFDNFGTGSLTFSVRRMPPAPPAPAGDEAPVFRALRQSLPPAGSNYGGETRFILLAPTLRGHEWMERFRDSFPGS